MTAGGTGTPTSTQKRAGRRTKTQRAWPARVASGLMTGLLVLAVLAALALAVVPRMLGGAALTVLSGSMEPLYSAGDVVVVVPAEPERIQMGDVVAYQPVSGDPTLVTHRVVAKPLGAEVRFVTRGDANGADDDPILPEQVVGRAAYHVPAVGHLALAARDHAQTLVTVTALGLFAYAAVMFLKPTRRRAAS